MYTGYSPNNASAWGFIALKWGPSTPEIIEESNEKILKLITHLKLVLIKLEIKCNHPNYNLVNNINSIATSELIRTKYTDGLYYNFLIEYVPFGIIVCQSHEINVKCGLEPLILKQLIPINSILILHINNSLCQLLIL